MFDRRRHRAVGQIAAIRLAERALARHELALAGERQRAAVDAREEAGREVERAAAEWHARLEGPFLPELTRALGAGLVARVDAAGEAQEHAEAMGEARELSEAEWCAADARSDRAEELVVESRRARARDREERALEATADRVTFGWRRA